MRRFSVRSVPERLRVVSPAQREGHIDFSSRSGTLKSTACVLPISVARTWVLRAPEGVVLPHVLGQQHTPGEDI